MSAIRKLATAMLDVVIKHSSPEARNWGSAMVREMDFVENDWSAALWALGSTTALCRYSLVRQLQALLHRKGRAWSLRGIAKKTPAMLSGMAAAGVVLALCALLLSSLLRASWFDPAQGRLVDRLLIVVVPEVLYLAGAVALWRRRKAIAVGILAAGAILIAHALVHFATRASAHGYSSSTREQIHENFVRSGSRHAIGGCVFGLSASRAPTTQPEPGASERG